MPKGGKINARNRGGLWVHEGVVAISTLFDEVMPKGGKINAKDRGGFSVGTRTYESDIPHRTSSPYDT